MRKKKRQSGEIVGRYKNYNWLRKMRTKGERERPNNDWMKGEGIKSLSLPVCLSGVLVFAPRVHTGKWSFSI